MGVMTSPKEWMVDAVGGVGSGSGVGELVGGGAAERVWSGDSAEAGVGRVSGSDVALSGASVPSGSRVLAGNGVVAAPGPGVSVGTGSGVSVGSAPVSLDWKMAPRPQEGRWRRPLLGPGSAPRRPAGPRESPALSTGVTSTSVRSFPSLFQNSEFIMVECTRRVP